MIDHRLQAINTAVCFRFQFESKTGVTIKDIREPAGIVVRGVFEDGDPGESD